jgi:dephospho-CoA kinase
MGDPGYYFGLTGGVASGKSTVARMFEALGAKVIDADEIGHQLLRAPLPAYKEVVSRFGREILNASGEIDRARLGSKVFADRDSLRELNAILHPGIIDRVEDLAAQYHAEAPHVVVLVDAALIYEAGIGGRFKKLLVAWCLPEQQIERLMAKTGLSLDDAQRRISSQMPAEEKRRRADCVIDCSGSLEKTREQVEALYPKLQELVREHG